MTHDTSRDPLMFDRVDLDVQHPDGTVERVVVMHQMRTPALAVLGEAEKAAMMGCETRIAAADMPIPPSRTPGRPMAVDVAVEGIRRLRVQTGLMEKIRNLKVPTK